MEAILNKEKWPKFLRVNGEMERVNFNKYLLKPWVKGEIVKVTPWEEQKSSCGEVDVKFRKRYVNVLRKDKDGKFTLHYNWDWKIFEPLK